MPFFSVTFSHGNHFKSILVGAGSPCKLTFNSFNYASTGDTKPALFAHQTNTASHHTQRAGYKFISKRTVMILHGQSVSEPAPTLINVNGFFHNSFCRYHYEN